MTSTDIATDLLVEQIKLKNFEDQAKRLIKDVSNINTVLNYKLMSEEENQESQTQLSRLLSQRDVLVRQLKTQKKIVKNKEEIHTYVKCMEDIISTQADEIRELKRKLRELKN